MYKLVYNASRTLKLRKRLNHSTIGIILFLLNVFLIEWKIKEKLVHIYIKKSIKLQC